MGRLGNLGISCGIVGYCSEREGGREGVREGRGEREGER